MQFKLKFKDPRCIICLGLSLFFAGLFSRSTHSTVIILLLACCWLSCRHNPSIGHNQVTVPCSLEHFECTPIKEDIMWHFHNFKCHAGFKYYFGFFMSFAQWNIFQSFVLLWKHRPTTWFRNFLTLSPMNWVSLQLNWVSMPLLSQLSWKKNQFICENVKNLRNHEVFCRCENVVGRHFHIETKPWKTFHCV